ncbi:LPS export ABC transporter periplasmic protein LptC [Pseudochryseolinea flava]|uniref:LPS export ABC transporter periplasmic protein LptC n=2 Tax=Pseudochryseolinea flava TaxID=2059302 RepID=A0A364YC41_9BACT|nr:LPS export ABC transporter periplasmic protein LptC [Pseudochryseolinea flava]
MSWLVLASCSKTEIKKPLEYEGPMREAENIEMFYTENDRVKVKMQAALLYEFQNGDQEFPKGIYLEFYDENGKLESKLSANHAYFFKEQDQWRGQGNVQVDNVATDEHLSTEELFWKRSSKKIFTDKFVTIRQPGEVIYGDGLDAEQDLSDYEIINPRGQTKIDD